jgi:hypothetical protein
MLIFNHYSTHNPLFSPQHTSEFELLKMPQWWHNVFAMVAPHFHHGATTFSQMTISFSGQCPKTWCLDGGKNC